jgi:ATPase family associated with various cellular activities (AAA)/Winged helix domain, variant
LRRLDALLSRVCDAEEARARRLYTKERGWDSLRATLAPPAAELAFDDRVPEAPLCPEHGLPALVRYRDTIGLASLETDVLFVLLAPFLEPRYAKLYAVLQDDGSGTLVTERLLFTVLGRTPARASALCAALSEDGRLTATGLVHQPAGTYAPRARPIELAPDVRDALLGVARPCTVAGAELAWRAGDGDSGPQSVEAVVGSGDRLAMAACVAGPLLACARLTAPPEPATLRALWRVAIAHAATLVLDLGDIERREAVAIATALVALVRRRGGAALLSSPDPLALPVRQHDAPSPSFAERRALWAAAAHERAVEIDAAALDRLAGNHRLARDQIDQAFDVSARLDPASLAQAAHRLGAVAIRHARAVPLGRTFDDLVLRDSSRDALERLIYFVGSRDRLAESLGLEGRFRLRRGPVVLFSGRSGTGKTLAAEVVAGAVGRPLFAVDLSQLVSKYIGETEKHIDEVLRAGERAGAVLFFDEADSMFASRTEVSSSNDRYANLEVGYLLQRIEQHDGLVILATNLQQTIDEAFLRRFHARVEFPFPDPGERRRIWSLMLGASAPEGADLDEVARQRLAGGDIRNAALKAIFLAEREGRAVGRPHIDRAVALELYELGRLSRRAIDEDDVGALLRELTEVLEGLLETELRRRFLKEIHLVHGAPTKETLAGRRPAVSLALYRLATNGEGGLRIGLIVSAWSQHPGEEHELLGVLVELLGHARVTGIAARPATLTVQKSFDFDLLHRFWSSHGHPMRPSVVLDVEIG